MVPHEKLLGCRFRAQRTVGKVYPLHVRQEIQTMPGLIGHKGASLVLPQQQISFLRYF